MDQMTSSMLELANMDLLAKMDSPVHRRHPAAKLLVTILYIFVVVSFPKDRLSVLFRNWSEWDFPYPPLLHLPSHFPP